MTRFIEDIRRSAGKDIIMKLTANVNMEQIEPFKSYLIQMTTHTDYIASKKNKTVLEQRILESHRAFMKQLERM